MTWIRRLWMLGGAGCQLVLGLVFFTGGMSKLMPFPGVMGPVWLEQALLPYGLDLYARFIGWSEALIGLLVLSGRFTPLGSVMLVPLIINILMVTISMDWRGTPYVVGVFLLMNAYLLAMHYPRWRSLILRGGPAPAACSITDIRSDIASLVFMVVVLVSPLVSVLSQKVAWAFSLIGIIGMLYVAGRSALRRTKRADEAPS